MKPTAIECRIVLGNSQIFYLQITASFPAPILPQDDIYFLTHILKVNFSFLPAVNGIISKKRH